MEGLGISRGGVERRRDVRSPLHDILRCISAVGSILRRAVAANRSPWPGSRRDGLVTASGTVMAHTADTTWQSGTVTLAAAAVVLTTRLNPMWMLRVGATPGGLGLPCAAPCAGVPAPPVSPFDLSRHRRRRSLWSAQCAICSSARSRVSGPNVLITPITTNIATPMNTATAVTPPVCKK